MIGQNTFKDSNEVYEALYAHIIMELVSAGENHLARQILDEQKELLVPNWYQDLWAILYEGKKPFTLEKVIDDADADIALDDPIVQNSRLMLAKLVKQKLLIVKPSNDKLIDLVVLARAK